MIEINNLTAAIVNKEFLKKVAKIVLKGENKREKGLSIVLVGPARIKELNKKYRGRDKTTDILSFSSNFQLELGEIVICLSEVKKNAKEFDSTFKRELSRVLIHGILHLLGYDHPDGVEDPRLININRDEKSKKEAEEMEAKQEYYLYKI